MVPREVGIKVVFRDHTKISDVIHRLIFWCRWLHSFSRLSVEGLETVERCSDFGSYYPLVAPTTPIPGRSIGTVP